MKKEQYIIFITLILAINLSFAQLTLTTPLTDIPLHLKVGDQLKITKNGYYIQEARMEFYRDLHRFIQDSIPDLLQIRAEYDRMSTQQAAEYQQQRDQLLGNQLQSKRLLKQAKGLSEMLNGHLATSTNQIRQLVTLGEDIEQQFKKLRNPTGFWQKAGAFVLGVGIGVAIIKI